MREGIAGSPLLDEAREHALDFADELPNFIVTQYVTRTKQTLPNKEWKIDDQLEIEITFRTGKGEDFTLLRVDGKPAKKTYQEIKGSTSTGEFGSMLAMAFAPQRQAVFMEVMRETIRGHPTVVYSFKVDKANSSTSLSDSKNGKTIVVGYTGRVWIDTESRRVLRIQTSDDEMPKGFLITQAESTVEYDWVMIAGERYLVPVRAEVQVGFAAQKFYTKNVIEFRNYRRFETKIKIDPN